MLGRIIGTLLSKPSNHGQYDHNSKKVSIYSRDMDFFNCPGQENTIVKYIKAQRAKNGTDYIIICCRINF